VTHWHRAVGGVARPLAMLAVLALLSNAVVGLSGGAEGRMLEEQARARPAPYHRAV